MLKIVVENSSKYKDNIRKLCAAAKMGSDYEILDPISHSTARHFAYVLVLGNVRCPGLKAGRIWQTDVPDSNLPNDKKNEILKTFQEVSKFLNQNRESNTALRQDVPPLKTLNEYLNQLNGRVVEIILEDNRMMGIYPDEEPLKMRYDIEYHASTIVNLARINELFDVKKIMIKES